MQYKEEQLALTLEDVTLMKMGMHEALEDAFVGQQQWND